MEFEKIRRRAYSFLAAFRAAHNGLYTSTLLPTPIYGGREGPFHSANLSISQLDVSNLSISNLNISNLDTIRHSPARLVREIAKLAVH